MKTLWKFLFLPFFFFSMAALVFSIILLDQNANQSIAHSDPVLAVSEKGPELASVAVGSAVAFAWKNVPDTAEYRLLLSFFHEESEIDAPYEINLGMDTEYVLDFEDPITFNVVDESIYPGLTFHARVEACGMNGVCLKSNAEHFQVGIDTSGSLNIRRTHSRLASDNVNIAMGNLACSYFLEPARSCVLGTDIFVPVGGTNPFTATDPFTGSGWTDGFTMSSNNTGIVTGGFSSPSEGIGWITGVSEGLTSINVWDGQGCLSRMTVRVLPAYGNYIYLSDMNPPPYPYSVLPAGVPITLSFRMRFPAVSGRYVEYRYALGMLGASANPNSTETKQIGLTKIDLVDTHDSETLAKSNSWSMTTTLSGTLPYGWDYLVVWVEYVDSDQTTVLAESCQAGWLIDNVIINQP